MKTQGENDGATSRLEALAEEIYAGLAAQFPVCLGSDEFHFFPHYRAPKPQWSRWDDFSDQALKSLAPNLAQWKQRLEALRPLQPSAPIEVDIGLLLRVLVTVREQLDLVQAHKNQPTFYLTIASIGMAEALDDSFQALGRRMRTLPDFIRAARDNLQQIPVLFRDLGLTMVDKMTAWLDLLPVTDDEQRPVASALDDLKQHLIRIETTSGFRLSPSIYGRITEHHLGCQMGLEEIGWHLDQEIEEAAYHLAQAAARIAPGKPWLSVLQDLPSPAAAGKDIKALYQSAVAKLKAHCREHQFFDADAMADGQVAIENIPEHLTPVRANAAYSMPAGHPPRGGVFYVSAQSHQKADRDAMLLAAHETYPGHHLLDTLRWQLPQPLRRCLEFPLFYEGWASFSEEILFDTEFFSGPTDRLLMAKRRFWRAQRGRADLNIHTGRASLEETAASLGSHGLVTGAQALAMAQRYALKPGYQLAYAVGRRKFRQLYTAYLGRGRTPGQFVSRALAHGEIGFDHLAEKLLY